MTPLLGQLLFGQFEQIEHGCVRGWVLDRLNPQQKLQLRVAVDGRAEAVIACGEDRPDLGHLALPARAIGFEYRIPPRYQDGMRHVLEFFTLGGQGVELPDGQGRLLREIHFRIAAAPLIDGVLDGLVDGMVQGWALKTDPASGEKTGGLRLLVSANGQAVAELVADQYRADVAEAGGVDPSCGFAYALPPDFAASGAVRLEVHAMPGRLALRHSPREVFLPRQFERRRLQALVERADELFRFAHELRTELRAALPVERYSLANYEAWAAENRKRIGARGKARYGEIKGRPLVSILCPVFRPALPDFCAALDSVAAQSYGNWELILVDDGSQDAGLSAVMAAAAKAEKRIRILVQGRNGGIAAATNRALKAARGEVCVFFDHDDVLEDVALEVMLRARSATGAKLLYSDEDKVNAAGRFCEPNLKPDFNYRFLLELNYICHLVMVDREVARAAGGFDPAFEFAQDHAFLLRLSEMLPASAIHHVPEILYHWRISERSAAGGGKPLAAAAGEKAVAAHLARRGKIAEVRRRGGLTCYKVAFQGNAARGVSVLIPFRNHIEMTRRCVAAVRERAGDLPVEFVLLDNWSQGADAEAFCVEQANLPETIVLRVAEPFNFSRLNNLGARAAKHEFLLLMNNDVRVEGSAWLRVLLDEMTAEPDIGAVGAKLLYPNGTIQHAGVVLGVGGVADHAFRGVAAASPGYVAHAIAAREVSAVTAACMLVRAEAFRAVGGFDEEELGVAFNDIDFCIRLRQAGWRVVFTPECVAEHQESMSRGDDLAEEKLARFMRENQVMLQRWGGVLGEDAFYNRHFARDGGVYRDLRVIEVEEEKRVGGA